ncbi:ATP-binding/permease protein CydC [Hartmannibacter diazotrophicus]|uniref:ATP-binding/permease protein CydC n=1 Tax=Hartmannibacter diazotrophicus TaxID=1482074 RepID=A0A2C9D3K6_9HYPH|nr:thiol reductant ABC exporter subunit CydC [Hartmannibacter diazotrophicus]SON54769.1 ATP-binding/permease protein CydC [Hartmannibacter diazotrophicus]
MTALLAILRFSLRQQAKRLIVGALLLLLTLAAGAGLMASAGYLIAGAGLAGLGLIAFNTLVPSSGIRLFALLRPFGRYGERLVTHDATLRLLSALRVSIFRGLMASGAKQRHGLMLNRLSSDVDALDGLTIRIAGPLAAALLATLLAAVALGLLSVTLMLAILAPALLLGLLLPLLLGFRARKDARRRVVALDALRVRLIDLDRGRTELALAGRLGQATSHVIDAADRASETDRRLARQEAGIRFVAGLGGQVSIALAALAGAPLLAQGIIDGPLFGLIVLGAFTAAELGAPIRAAALDLGRMAVAGRRIAPLMLDDDRLADDGVPKMPCPGTTADLDFDAVRFAYAGDRPPVLGGLSLSIPEGRRVAIIGPSGCGKSTVAGLASGLLHPTEGTVRIGGAGLVRPGLAANGLRVGLLSQETRLFSGSIADNLRLGRPDATDGDLMEACQTAGFTPVLARLEAGLASRLGDGGSGLSGGERRRLALARLLVAKPDVFVLDEPTEGLDEESAAMVLAGLDHVTRGATVVLVTHLHREARLADAIWRLGPDGSLEASAARGEATFEALQKGLR